jgi:hypothetical protein
LVYSKNVPNLFIGKVTILFAVCMMLQKLLSQQKT